MTAKRKRSHAAKLGWKTRRARIAESVREWALPFLTADGMVYVWPRAKSARSSIGSYWNAVDRFLSTGSLAALAPFRGQSIYDAISGERLAFVTNRNVIIAYSDMFDFGASFYRNRREVGVLA